MPPEVESTAVFLLNAIPNYQSTLPNQYRSGMHDQPDPSTGCCQQATNELANPLLLHTTSVTTVTCNRCNATLCWQAPVLPVPQGLCVHTVTVTNLVHTDMLYTLFNGSNSSTPTTSVAPRVAQLQHWHTTQPLSDLINNSPKQQHLRRLSDQQQQQRQQNLSTIYR